MKLKKHILFVLLFILVQGITFAVTWYGFGFRYASAQEARFSVISEAILALMVLVYIRRTGCDGLMWCVHVWLAGSEVRLL